MRVNRACAPSGTMNRMHVRSIDHVQLAMPAGGEGQAEHFYGGLLGMTPVAKPAHLAARGGCWFESGAARIHLGVDTAFHPARKAHPALVVERLAELVETLRAAGAEVSSDQPLEGFERVYVDDPFGNRVELMEANSS